MYFCSVQLKRWFGKGLLVSLLVLFVTNGAVVELVKIPTLVKHFEQHKAQNHSIDFADFLVMHYLGSDNNDSDNDQDEQLPFKKATGFSVIDIGTVVNPEIAIYLEPRFVLPETKQVLRQPQMYVSLHPSAVFRPPIS